MANAVSAYAPPGPAASRPGAGAAQAGSATAPKPAAPTGAASVPGGLKSSPAVINAVKVPAGSGVFGTTQADIQTAVNGINAQIENFRNMDWAGATPDQIAKAQQWDMTRLMGAEGATIALAGESGVTGVSFNYEKMNGATPSSTPVASPPSQGSFSTSPSAAAAPSASTPSTQAAAPSPSSAARIALTVLTGSSAQNSPVADNTRRADVTA